MKTVLCIDAGDFGGGSAESLYTHICSLKSIVDLQTIHVLDN